MKGVGLEGKGEGEGERVLQTREKRSVGRDEVIVDFGGDIITMPIE